MTRCCDITAGELNVLITIERRTRADDGQGGVTETWAADPSTGVWAKVKALTGTEAWEAQRVAPGTLLKAFIRFRGDSLGAPYYSAADRVIIRGREYSILNITDVEMKQTWLEMYLHEGRPS